MLSEQQHVLGLVLPATVVISSVCTKVAAVVWVGNSTTTTTTTSDSDNNSNSNIGGSKQFRSCFCSPPSRCIL